MNYSIYICDKCRKIFKVKADSKNPRCNTCSAGLISLGVSFDRWEKLSKEEREAAKNKILSANANSNTSVGSIKSDNDNKNKGKLMYVCPSCKTVFKVNGSGKTVKCNNCNDVLLLELNEEYVRWSSYEPEYKRGLIEKAIAFNDNARNNGLFFDDYDRLKHLYDSKDDNAVFRECNNLLSKNDKNYVANMFKSLSTCRFSYEGDAIEKILTDTGELVKNAYEELGSSSEYVCFLTEFVKLRLTMIEEKKSYFSKMVGPLSGGVVLPYLLGIKNLAQSTISKDDYAGIVKTLADISRRVKVLAKKSEMIALTLPLGAAATALNEIKSTEEIKPKESSEIKVNSQPKINYDLNYFGICEKLSKAYSDNSEFEVRECIEKLYRIDSRDPVALFYKYAWAYKLENPATNRLQETIQVINAGVDAGTHIARIGFRYGDFVGLCLQIYTTASAIEAQYTIELHEKASATADFGTSQIEELVSAYNLRVEYYQGNISNEFKDQYSEAIQFVGSKVNEENEKLDKIIEVLALSMEAFWPRICNEISDISKYSAEQYGKLSLFLGMIVMSRKQILNENLAELTPRMGEEKAREYMKIDIDRIGIICNAKNMADELLEKKRS